MNVDHDINSISTVMNIELHLSDFENISNSKLDSFVIFQDQEIFYLLWGHNTLIQYNRGALNLLISMYKINY